MRASRKARNTRRPYAWPYARRVHEPAGQRGMRHRRGPAPFRARERARFERNAARQVAHTAAGGHLEVKPAGGARESYYVEVSLHKNNAQTLPMNRGWFCMEPHRPSESNGVPRTGVGHWCRLGTCNWPLPQCCLIRTLPPLTVGNVRCRVVSRPASRALVAFALQVLVVLSQHSYLHACLVS